MKVLMGHFTIESNEHVPGLTELDDFNLKFGDSLVDAMFVGDIFRESGIEIVPSIYADAHAAKVLSKEAYKYISDKMLRVIQENIKDLDGIFLQLHGASNVEGLAEGSGERELLKNIRKLTGPYLPICVVMDPHGNLTEEYVSMMTMGRCYRHSPHTDIKETNEFVARKLVELLQNKKFLQAQYKKLPFVLGGERSVSTDEPMLSINKKLDELEQDQRILSTSFHVGYLRHDNFATGSGLIVVPSDMKYKDYANELLDSLHDFCVSKYGEFHYHGNALAVHEAIHESIVNTVQHTVVTDSGDNVTSGAIGDNTYFLNEYLTLRDYKGKRLLFAAIYDPKLFNNLFHSITDDYVDMELGTGRDDLSTKISLTAKVTGKGSLENIFGDTDKWGGTVTISVKDKPIDIVIIDKSISFAEYHQFSAANIDLEKYNLVVVKQGYIFPDLKEYADMAIMALTDGPTNQRTEDIVFKSIMRPMLPFDQLN